jgi:hypothetical protein
MANNQSNITTIQIPPLGERKYYATPRIKTFLSDDPADLETSVNAWIDTLATPIGPIKYSINDFSYTSAQLANNTINYSVLVRYNQWTPV